MSYTERLQPAASKHPRFLALSESVGLVTLGLLTACSSSSTVHKATAPTSTAISPSSPASPSTSPRSTREPILTFNDLGGGSVYIEVYPGTGHSAADKKYDGVYQNGQTASVVCEEVGRVVKSHPEVGEKFRVSDEWFKLQTPTSAPLEFATAVYADVSGAPVPKC